MNDNQRSSRLFMIVFAVFMIGGCLTALIMVNQLNPESQDLLIIPDSPSTTAQNVYLVVGLDQLENDKPKLLSIWLVSHPISSAYFSLQPIYPPDRSIPHSDLIVDPDDPSAIDKLIEILRIEFYWTNVVWLDETTMVKLVEIASRSLPAQPETDSATRIENLPKPWRSPSSALEAQQNLLMELCSNSHAFSGNDMLKEILSLYPEHLRIDLDEVELLNQWNNLYEQGFALECEFPPEH